MLFSVLIPAFNCEKYIDSCISSVMNQTFQDFELVIVDDGSSDKTAEKCSAWAGKYPEQVRFISKDNSGVYLTRRCLLREAKGEYICFIDADDKYIGNDVLAEIKRVIDSTSCDLVFFNATSDLHTMKKMFNYTYLDGQTFEEDDIAEIYRLFVNTKEFQHIWNKVFKKTLIDYETTDEPFGFRMLRDGVFQLVPIISNAEKIVYLDKVLYFYRTDNENSVSHVFKIDFYYSMVVLHKRILEYSRTWKHKNDETDDYIKAGCTADMCISAIKARDLPKSAPINRNEYIKMISNEPLFRQQYNQKHLDNFRKPVAWALYHRQYWMVNMTSSIVGIGKKAVKKCQARKKI